MTVAPTQDRVERPPTTQLIEVRGLVKEFEVGPSGFFGKQVTRRLRAVDSVDLAIAEGETVALVGESGCGKSTLGRCIARLETPTAGQIMFEGQDLATLKGAALRRTRRHIQVIFQDPSSSLTPRMTVRRLIEEPLRIHGLARTKRERDERVKELLDSVGLLPNMADRYPHEFSGGQRQRVAIARALAYEPRFIVCDEAVSALDVSIQVQILNLLKELQERFDLTYLFITHDLASARFLADRVAVMYLGQVVELASAVELFAQPAHPYTEALISAVPVPDPLAEAERLHVHLEGEPASPLNKPSGCVFHPRCAYAVDSCRTDRPEREVLLGTREVACHLPLTSEDAAVQVASGTRTDVKEKSS